MYVTELFKEFQKDRLKEAKKSDYDYMQEIYSRTELFDFTNINDDIEMDFDEFRKTLSVSLPLQFFSLPFENVFVKTLYNMNDTVSQELGIFLREYSPNILTGTITMNYKFGNLLFKYNLPFTIHLDEKCTLLINKIDYQNIINAIEKLYLANEKSIMNKINQILQLNKKTGKKSEIDENFKEKAKNEFLQIKETTIKMVEGGFLCGIIQTQKVFEKLSKHEIIVDKNEKMKPEYYSFKDKAKKTIKVTNRPIYYVLDKKDYEKRNYHIKPIGKLEYSHAFKVRGHWRRIDVKSIGKDRNGDYKIEGFTWVIDHIRG